MIIILDSERLASAFTNMYPINNMIVKDSNLTICIDVNGFLEFSSNHSYMCAVTKLLIV